MSSRVPYMRGNTKVRDHIWQLMTNVEAGYIGRVSGGPLPDLIAPRHTNNSDIFLKELPLADILKWVWRVKTWVLNGTCSFKCDGPRAGFLEDGSSMTGAVETASVTLTFNDFPVKIRNSLVPGSAHLATTEREILGGPGAFAGPDSGIDPTLFSTPYPGNYIQNSLGEQGPAGFLITNPKWSYTPTGSAVATFTNTDGTVTIAWTGITLPPNSIDFGFGVPDPHTPPPTAASVGIGVELLHFDPSGAGDLSPDITDPHEDDQVIWRPTTKVFLPAIYVRFDIGFSTPIELWTSNATRNATYGPDRPNDIPWPLLLGFASIGSIAAWSDLDGDWGSANSAYADQDPGNGAINPPISTGSIVIDSTAAVPYTCPLHAFYRAVSSPNTNDQPYDFATAGLTLNPDEFWAYQTSDGLPVYDEADGSQINDPFQ